MIFFKDRNKQAHLNHERTNKSTSITLYLGTIHILRKHIFGIFGPPSPPTSACLISTKNKQKLAFSDPPPPSPPTSADVIYEWSLTKFDIKF